MNSQGLGILINTLRSIRDLGGSVGLVTGSPRLKHVLELCARDRHCKIYNRKRDAIKALSAAARPKTAA
jgi:anti-anti-sigma regulatory factor